MVKKDEIDWEKVAEMQQSLDAFEAEKRERTKIFNPIEISRKAKEIREVHDEDLGTIRFVLLTYDDVIEIFDKYKDNRDRSMQILFKQLEPANPELKIEDVRRMPYEAVVRLITLLQTDGSFFPHKRPLPNGLTLTQQHNPLVS